MSETQYPAPVDFMPMARLRHIARSLGLTADLAQTRSALITAITTYGD